MKKTVEELISDFRRVHGDKYDYSLIRECSDVFTKLPIICKKHGVFYQDAHNHLYVKCGCTACGRERTVSLQKGRAKKTLRKALYGKAHFDMDCTCNGDNKLIYSAWKSMLDRCFGGRSDYKECSICSEWLLFSNFHKWAVNPSNNFRKGYHLDKDILVKGNKVYSPQTCCFVPREINDMLVKGNKKNRKSVLGVNKIGKSYYPQHGTALLPNFDKSLLRHYKTEREAFSAYAESKEKYIKEVADEYYNKGLITERVYDALYNWTIEITD